MSMEEELWRLKAVMISGARTPDEQRDLIYFFFAKMFGWTPNQVDEIGNKTLRKLLYLLKEDMRRQELWRKKFDSR